MTPTDEQLEKWAAEKVMGWALRDDGLWLDKTTNKFPKQLSHGWKEDPLRPEDGSDFYQEPWHPLTDLNQTFMCVEKLYETKKWLLSLTKLDNGNWEAYFADWTKEYRCYESGDEIVGKVIEDPNSARAILLAAWRATKEK